MATTVNVGGLATVKVGTGAADALETLGYTRQGVTITAQDYYLDVPGDQNGGDEGPPIDVQYMGETAIVRLELTKWDVDIEDKVVCRVKGGTAGSPSASGTLMNANGAMRLLVDTPTRPYNFPQAFPRKPIEVNRGTKFSTLIIEFECHENQDGVLYNRTTD